MTTIQIQLPETLEDFITAQAAAEGYDTPGDYVLALVCLAQRRSEEARLLAGVHSLDRGDGKPMIPSDWERLRANIRARHGDEE